MITLEQFSGYLKPYMMYGLSEKEARALCSSKDKSDYFEDVEMSKMFCHFKDSLPDAVNVNKAFSLYALALWKKGRLMGKALDKIRADFVEDTCQADYFEQTEKETL